MPLQIIGQDITKMPVDAIVNTTIEALFEFDQTLLGSTQ